MTWTPDNRTRETIRNMVERLFSSAGEVLGIDETIAGCEIVNLDPYGVGGGTIPRWVRVALRGSATDGYNVDAMYRGGYPIGVGDSVVVTHFRDGNRYEVTGPGGSTGAWRPYIPTEIVVLTPTGSLTTYPTIVAAVTAAASGDWVLIPPGTYNETVTLKNGVMIVEWITGTVTIERATAAAVICADGGHVRVYKISTIRDINAGVYAIDATTAPTAGNECMVIADIVSSINANVGAASNAMGFYCRYNGTLRADVRDYVCTGAYAAAAIYANSGSGTIFTHYERMFVTSGGGYAYGGYTFAASFTMRAYGDYAYIASASWHATGFALLAGSIYAYRTHIYVTSLTGVAAAFDGANSGSGILVATGCSSYITGSTIGRCVYVQSGSTAVFTIIGGIHQVVAGATRHGVRCSGGTLYLYDCRVTGSTYDLYQNGGTLYIASVQYDTYFGTITLLTESMHSLISELEDTTELTIAAGVITATQSYHRIDTQANDPSDDLDTINGGVIGRLLVIRPENGARTVVVKHNTGNIWLLSGTDVTLDDINDHILLIYDGTKWCSVDEGGGGAGAPHNLLSATHSDTVASAVTQGDIVVGTVGGWDDLPIGTAQQLLQVNAGATDPAWTSFDWDNMVAGAGSDMVHDHSAAGEGGTVSIAAAQFLALAVDVGLANERVLTPGDGVDGVDSGAGAAYTLSVDVSDLLGAWMGEDLSGDIRFQPNSPAVISAAGAVTEYATIQNAINAAIFGEFVVIPPGTYAINALTLKAGVPVVELISDTVTLDFSGNMIGIVINTAGSFLLSVYHIYASHSDEFDFLIGLNQSNGTLYLYLKRLYIYNNIAISIDGLSVTSGAVMYVYGPTNLILYGTVGPTHGCTVGTTSEGYFYSVLCEQIVGLPGYDLYNDGGDLYVYACQYNRTATFGTITRLDGDVRHAVTSDAFDLNGVADAGVLDADGDTSISAPIDDQIDVEVGGTDQVRIIDGMVYPVTDNDIDFGDPTHELKNIYVDGIIYADLIDLGGNADALQLDADGDTTISAPVDDQIDFEVGGADIMVLTPASLLVTPDVRALAYGKGLQAQINDVMVYTGSNLTLTTAYQLITGITTGAFTPASNESALIFMNGVVQQSAGTAICNAEDQLSFELYDATAAASIVFCNRLATGGTGSLNNVRFYIMNLTGGVTYTLQLRARNTTGNRGVALGSSQLMVWRLGRA